MATTTGTLTVTVTDPSGHADTLVNDILAAYAAGYPQFARDAQGDLDPNSTFGRWLVAHIQETLRTYKIGLARQAAEQQAATAFDAAAAGIQHNVTITLA